MPVEVHGVLIREMQFETFPCRLRRNGVTDEAHRQMRGVDTAALIETEFLPLGQFLDAPELSCEYVNASVDKDCRNQGKQRQECNLEYFLCFHILVCRL